MRSSLVIIAMLLVKPAAAQMPVEKSIHDFTGMDTSVPSGPVIRDAAGNLYGGTGGLPFPVVYRLSPPAPGQKGWTYTTLHTFNTPTDDSFPVGRLLLDPKGNIYGATYEGGAEGLGSVFMLSPAPPGQTEWTETILYSFSTSDVDAYPYGDLIMDQAGTIYGSASLGGGIFTLTPPASGVGAWAFQIIYTFNFLPSGFPQPGLLIDQSGALYGSATGYYYDSVFKLSPPQAGPATWTLATLYEFKKGTIPNGELISNKSGELFGTSEYGGSANNGTVFKLAPPAAGRTAWTETTLHEFNVETDGENPLDGLLSGRGCILYGTTFGTVGSRAPTGGGSVFSLTPPAPGQTGWTETAYIFANPRNGANPRAPLISTGRGSLIGTTEYGGAYGNFGTVFQIGH